MSIVLCPCTLPFGSLPLFLVLFLPRHTGTHGVLNMGIPLVHHLRERTTQWQKTLQPQISLKSITLSSFFASLLETSSSFMGGGVTKLDDNEQLD